MKAKQNVSVRNRAVSSRRKSVSTSSPTKLIEKQLKQRKIEQQEYRKSLIIYKKPLSTLFLFSIILKDFCHKLLTNIITSPFIILILLPIFTITFIHFLIPTQINLIENMYYYIEWTVWWLILGILSSIGLGTGMHSGLLFLFPFIGQVCMVAALCHSLDFNTFGPNSFHCQSQNNTESSTVTFWGLFFKVFWPCFLWGSGTAIGEIPPYVVSLAAAKASKAGKLDELDDEINYIKNVSNSNLNSNNNFNIFERMKIWMIKCLELYGFWGVLAFAAWPNMAFDMCGIACGYFEMSFWTFFGATFIGKALIKINLQSIFFIIMFNDSLNNFIEYIEHLGFEWLAVNTAEFFEKQRKIILGETIKENEKTHTPIFKIIWTSFVGSFILVFIGSTIQLLARQKQKEIDEKNNKQFEESQ